MLFVDYMRLLQRRLVIVGQQIRRIIVDSDRTLSGTIVPVFHKHACTCVGVVAYDQRAINT